MSEHAEFDPTDPFDVACEAIRGELLLAALRVLESPALARLPLQSARLEAVMAAGTVAVACMALSFVDRDDAESVAAIRRIMTGSAGEWFDYASTIAPVDEGAIQ